MPGPVTAILLAAGSSRRIGSPKQLLPLTGKPVIRHCLDAILGSGIERPVVVLGQESEEVRRVIEGLPVMIVFNEKTGSEMAESVRVGLTAVEDTCSGVLICLSDHPLVTPDTYRTLLKRHRQDPGCILIPTFRGRKGHPALFPLTVLKKVFSGSHLRQIIRQNSENVKLVPLADEGVILDLDTEEDYRRLREFRGDA